MSNLQLEMLSAESSKSLFDSSECLYKNLKQKNIHAFEFVYDKYSTALFSLIVSIMEDPFTANVILERVFKNSWKKIGEFDEKKSSLFTWMLAITREETLVEKKQQELKKLLKPGISDGFKNLGGFRELINELLEPCRSILLLSYFENQSDISIATILKEDLSTVKVCKNKGLGIINKLITIQGKIKKPSLISERVLAF